MKLKSSIITIFNRLINFKVHANFAQTHWHLFPRTNVLLLLLSFGSPWFRLLLNSRLLDHRARAADRASLVNVLRKDEFFSDHDLCFSDQHGVVGRLNPLGLLNVDLLLLLGILLNFTQDRVEIQLAGLVGLHGLHGLLGLCGLRTEKLVQVLVLLGASVRPERPLRGLELLGPHVDEVDVADVAVEPLVVQVSLRLLRLVHLLHRLREILVEFLVLLPLLQILLASGLLLGRVLLALLLLQMLSFEQLELERLFAPLVALLFLVSEEDFLAQAGWDVLGFVHALQICLAMGQPQWTHNLDAQLLGLLQAFEFAVAPHKVSAVLGELLEHSAAELHDQLRECNLTAFLLVDDLQVTDDSLQKIHKLFEY